MLNEYLCNEMFEDDYENKQFDKCQLFAVGSILGRLIDHDGKLSKADKEIQKKARYDDEVHIWGSGFLYDCNPEINKFIRKPVIHALRGEYTKDRIEKILNEPIRCVLADPGLLAPLFVPFAEDKKWNVGIIPHYRDKNNELFENLLSHYKNAIMIDVQQDVETVFRQISQCHYIISSSLHGIVVADAYDIPNCWVIGSDQVFGDGYKFHDYYSSLGTDREVIDLREGLIPDLKTDFRKSFIDYRQIKVKQISLINAFPFALKDRFRHTKTETEKYKDTESFPSKTTADRYEIVIEATKNPKPAVSIIIPVYNTVEYLDECLASIEKQSMKDLEIICVDDGSSDGSLDVLLDHALKDKRITVVAQENCGQSAARNLGMDLAKGKYLYFVDSDDYIDADSLKVLYNQAEKNHLDVLLFDAVTFFDDDVTKNIYNRGDDYYIRKHEYPELVDGKTLFAMMLQNGEYRVQPGMMFYLRSFMNEHGIRFIYGVIHEDEEFAFNILLNANRVGYMSRQFYHRRMRLESTMTQNVRFANAYGYYSCYKIMNRDIALLKAYDPENGLFIKHVSAMIKLAKNRYSRLNSKEKAKYKLLPPGARESFEILIAKDIREIDKLSDELQKIRSSNSYRIGRFITYIPRRIKSMIKKYKKHKTQSNRAVTGKPTK